MALAEKISLTAAILFFITGLITGIWKWRAMSTHPEAEAPYYVNIAHRAALMYSFAALLLAVLSHHSAWSDTLNLVAVVASNFYFGFAIVTYIIHGVLKDTDNQLKRPHRLGSQTVPSALLSFSMVSLIIAELGGALILGSGALVTLWGG